MKFKITFKIWLLSIALVTSVTVNHEDDPNVPDQSDMDIINQFTQDRAELDKDKDQKPTTESQKDSEAVSTTSTTTTEVPPGEKVQHLKDGEPCRCVKYYFCNVVAGSNNTDGNETFEIDETSIRSGELKHTEKESNVTEVQSEDAPIECPHYFDVCCPLKDIKEENKEADGDKPGESGDKDEATTTTTEKPHPPPPKDSAEYEHTTCGHRNENGVKIKVTGATKGEAQFGEFPWTAAVIQLETTDDNVTINKYIGGGSLIHPQVVMTVAHVALGKARNSLRVRLGEWDTQTNDEPYPSQDRGVTKVIIHEQFLKKTLFNDIALLILDEEVRLAPNVETICLPPLNRKLKFQGQVCFSSGWGKTDFGAAGRYSEIMKRVSVPVVSREECQKELEKSDRLPGFRLHKSYMCAGGGDEDTCNGDGGSPLVCSISGKSDHKHYVQVGAVSWGLNCLNSSFPGVYTDIMYMTPWILKQMDKEGMSSDYFSIKN